MEELLTRLQSKTADSTKLKNDDFSKQFVTDLVSQYTEGNQNEFLQILNQFLNSLDSSEFTEKLDLFTEGAGTKVLDILLSLCQAKFDLTQISQLITCLAYVTNKNIAVKRYLYDNDIISGIQALLLNKHILTVFSQLFDKFDVEGKATSTQTNVQFVTALLSSLLTLTTNCPEIQKDLSEKGIVELLCKLYENSVDSPKELLIVFATLAAVIESYIVKSMDLLPNKIVTICKTLIFSAKTKGIRVSALRLLVSIAELKLDRFRDFFRQLLSDLMRDTPLDYVIHQSSLLLFKTIASDKKIEAFVIIPYITQLIEIMEKEENNVSLMAIECLNQIALRDESLSIISSKVSEVVTKAKESEGNMYSTLMILLANMGRTDETIAAYRKLGVADIIVNYMNGHQTEEQSLLMSLSVLSAISVLKDNRDYLVNDVKIFEVLEKWYHYTKNQVIIFNNQQIISRLILNSPERAEVFMKVDNALNNVVETATYTVRLVKEKRTPETATREIRDVRVSYEATRIVCNLIQFKPENAVEILKDEYILFSIAELVNSRYDILRTEGGKALETIKQLKLCSEQQVDDALSRKF
ncbi:hypothetical protein EIN_057670 [Entamoeba invadens IP1]|uniref:hypothetical protein n=1 Tax=Entamoeba invadens IP1 TaxID=370355 RepID=UPI0002C3F491|nr:hypothetical protein EIN_057670 [Entamoeba invadens IP1]ELP93362.1 hypothetical protein EIN_057670 [Entamoeba invadens IP1]|eukprot:XP_004260133.1 hypothetical protein EIN_057670 [Entamoeba invadens IP1]